MRNHQRGVTLVEILIVLVTIGILAALFFGSRGCDHLSDDKAVEAAEAHGYSEVEVLDRHDWWASWNGCSDSDAVAFDMRGKNPVGRPVDFTLCCGTARSNGKGCTVRIK